MEESKQKAVKPTAKRTQVGLDILLQSRAKEAEELLKEPKTRARKKKLEDLTTDQKEKAI